MKKSHTYKEEDIEFITPNGVKVLKSDPPSQDACVRFMKAIYELKAKYDIK